MDTKQRRIAEALRKKVYQKVVSFLLLIMFVLSCYSAGDAVATLADLDFFWVYLFAGSSIVIFGFASVKEK